MKKRLEDILLGYGKIAVAFSGGIDSMTLLTVSHRVLKNDVIALLAVGTNFPIREQKEAEKFCLQESIRLYKLPFHPFSIREFSQNGEDRCYYCKKALWQTFNSVAKQEQAVLVDGTNIDDEDDKRPGWRATLEAGVKSPLLEAEMGKKEIRLLAKELGLKQWQKPSMACLASRVRYGDRLDETLLNKIDMGENFLRTKGFKNLRLRVADGRINTVEVGHDELKMYSKLELYNLLCKFYDDNTIVSENFSVRVYTRGFWNTK